MNRDVGEKIRDWATAIGIIGVTGCVILAIVFFVIASDSFSSDIETQFNTLGTVILIAGSAASILSAMILSAFGAMVHNSFVSVELLRKMSGDKSENASAGDEAAKDEANSVSLFFEGEDVGYAVVGKHSRKKEAVCEGAAVETSKEEPEEDGGKWDIAAKILFGIIVLTFVGILIYAFMGA